MKTVYFVVSLPRTGTKSISKMAQILGFNTKHGFGNGFETFFDRGFDFFADTPSYVPSFIESVCKSEKFIPKFIYIDKNFDEIYQSWVKVGLYKNYVGMWNQYNDEEKKTTTLSRYSLIDIESYSESFLSQFMNEKNYQELFQKHQDKIFEIIQKNNRNLLIYNFSDGWKPLCEFLNKDIRNEVMPHINQNTMFDKI
jgi:hypothetical protein